MPRRTPVIDDMPIATSRSTQAPAFSYQFAEIEDLERMHVESANTAPPSPHPPTEPSPHSPTPQLPTPASTPPRLPTPDIPLLNVNSAQTPETRRAVVAINNNLLARHHAIQAARVQALTSRLARIYSIDRLLNQRPPPAEPHQITAPRRTNSNALLEDTPARTLMGEFASRRRTHSNAFGPRSDPAVINFLHPIKRRLCSVYAVEVQVGDILKYGNKLNEGCRVTAAYLDEREEEDQSPATSPSEGELSPSSRAYYRDDDEEEETEREGEEEGDINEDEDGDKEAKPVVLNGTVRIQWESKSGQCRQSQLFEGLEVLEVSRRVGSKWDEEEQED